MKEFFKFFGDMYYWWWHDFVCRLEPYTHQWRRQVAKWWLLDIILAGAGAAAFIWMLCFPLSNIATPLRVAIIVVGGCVAVFFAWLLLHLGGYCMKAIVAIRRLVKHGS